VNSGGTANIVNTSGNNTFTVANAGTETFNGGTGNPTLTLSGAGTNTITTGSGTDTITSSATAETLIAGTGTTSLTLTAGTATMNAGGGTATTSGQRKVVFSNINLATGTKLVLGASGSHATRTVLVVPNASTTLAGTAAIDVKDNDMIVTGGGATGGPIQTAIKTGFAAGAWNGKGINSSTAAATGLNAVGYSSAGDLGASNFDGIAVGGTDMLVKYTYYGDATLDGKVDIDDYSLIDFFAGTSTGATWLMGDFTYDGAVNIDDYSLIDFEAGFGTPGNPNPQL
jgi:hypothetical protein